MNERNTLVVSVAVAISTAVLIVSILIGNTLTSRETARVDVDARVQLVKCIQTGKSAVECRTLIYGMP